MEKTKKKFSINKTVVFVGLSVGIVILIAFGIFVGIWAYPRTLELISRITGDEVTTGTITGTTKIVSEENAVIDVVAKSKNSVVSIALSQLELQPGQGVVSQQDNVGTGFIIDPTGLIITNQHVVSLADQDYKVITADGKSYDVVEKAIDDVNDVAILKINATDLSAVTLGDSDNLKVGQLVVAIGTPLGQYAGSVTTGVISGLNRSVETQSGSFWSQTSKQYENVIQTDAAINPGNSGGPLLNSAGEVIGVNFATTSGADNISFALPINNVKTRIEEYRKYGKFIRPYMGVEYEMISQSQALYYKNVVPGAFIVRVSSGSPASKAGILRGDIITKFGEDTVTTSLSSLIQKHKVGDTVAVDVWRNNKSQTLSVKLEEAN